MDHSSFTSPFLYVMNVLLKMDCSDEKFQLSVIQTALQRGNSALNKSNYPSNDNTVDLFYQSSSSSGISSDSDAATSEEVMNNVDAQRIDMTNIKPKRMTKQVGGISSHKHPLLILDPHFILKPLKLKIPCRGISSQDVTMAKRDVEKEIMATAKTCNDKKLAKEEDLTKVYRGVREIAFYEALQFACSLSLPPTMDFEFLSNLSRVCAHPCIGCNFKSKENISVSTPDATPLFDANQASSQSSSTYSNAVALLAAYFAVDSLASSSTTMYSKSWHNLFNEMKSLKQLAKFTSPYYGFVDLSTVDKDSIKDDQNYVSPQQSSLSIQQPYLLLGNLTANFIHPNVIDIKMGTQTYEPSAPKSKQTRETRKYPQQSEIGFRIVGMRVYDPSSATGDGYRYWDKRFGVSLTTRNAVMEALMLFFCNGREGGGTSYTMEVLSLLIEKLSEIKNWFEKSNATLTFYASSILMVYEGSNSVLRGQLGVAKEPVLKLIDFAHVCRKVGGDMGYLKGVANLLCILKEIREKSNVVLNQNA